VKLLRNKLLLVAAVCIAPFVLGTAAFLFGWTPGGQANYGELIPPRPLAAAPIASLKGKWVMVAFDAAGCDAYCEKKLYFMRQVRRAQGKEMDRVERLWVLTDAGKPRAELLAAIEGTHLASSAELKGFDVNAADHLYLVDPQGNLMMRFPRDPDPTRMIKDLQRLLKYVRAG
jgi:cytochrome oxidase Cu insertion factor (SCO1/SenC/PrrC family)